MIHLHKLHIVAGLIVPLFIGTVFHAEEQKPPATIPSSEISLSIQAIRIARSGRDASKRFRSGIPQEVNGGVSLTLLMNLGPNMVLPISREAVSIETFVDDTYESLIAGGNEGVPGVQAVTVSDDGTRVAFQIQSSRSPSEKSGRVFVRGALRANMVVGQLKRETATLPLVVGSKVDIGPFPTVLRGVSDTGQSKVGLTLAVGGNAGRIRKVRVLSMDDKPLGDESITRLNESDAPNRGAHLNVYLPNNVRDQVKLEYSFAEDVRPVRIPFEAQVDLGVTKAGPIELANEQQGRVEQRSRVWPPPPGGQADLPERRAAFNPSTEPAVAAKLQRAGVDLFSVTVGKPAPGEAEGAQWNNPPSPSFRAGGFSLFRLMLSTPGMRILLLPPDAVQIRRFEDDRGGKLETAMYRISDPLFPTTPPTSPDGQQSLFTICMASAPHPGATRCMLGGSIRASVGTRETTHNSKSMTLEKGQQFTTGPFSGRIVSMHAIPQLTPDGRQGSAAVEAQLLLDGPLDTIYLVEVVQDSKQQVIGQQRFFRPDAPIPPTSGSSLGIRMTDPGNEPVIIRITHFEKIETVELPFELSTTIGL